MDAGEDLGADPISDTELTALALAADPDAPLDPGAVPMDLYRGTRYRALPEWYMAPVMARVTGRCRRLVVVAVISAFLVIEAFGLFSTYGQLPFGH